jgi:hypothetical protein
MCRIYRDALKYILLWQGNLSFSIQKIVGPRRSGAQYGTALSSLGDINRDGYNGKQLIAAYFIISTNS